MEGEPTPPRGTRHAMQKQSARAPSAVEAAKSSREDLIPTAVITGQALIMAKRMIPTGTAGSALQGRYRPTTSTAHPALRVAPGSIQTVGRQNACHALQVIIATEVRTQDARHVLLGNTRARILGRRVPHAR